MTRDQTESSGSVYYEPWTFLKTEQYGITLSAQYGYPFSLSLHWYSQASLVVPVYGGQKKADQRLSSALYYQLGEKVSNELSLTFTKRNQFVTLTNSPDREISTNNFTVGNTVRYFVENNIYFSVKIAYTDWKSAVDLDIPWNRSTEGGMSITFGLNYRFY